jgi:hypothetical protein
MPFEPDPPFEPPPAAPPLPAPPAARPLKVWGPVRIVGAMVSLVLCLSGVVVWDVLRLPLDGVVSAGWAVILSILAALLLWMPFWGLMFYVCLEGRLPGWRSVGASVLDVLAHVALPYLELPTHLLVLLVRALRPLAAGLALVRVGLGLRPWLQQLEARLEAGIERRTRGRRNWLGSLLR